MRIARPLSCLLAAVCAAACSSSNPAGAPPTGRVASPAPLTPAFQTMGGVIREGTALVERGDAAGLRALSPRVLRAGLGLLKARPPHHLRRADMARYEEGRGVFGEALKRWAWAVEDPRNSCDLRPVFESLAAAFRGWTDAASGLPPERAV